MKSSDLVGLIYECIGDSAALQSALLGTASFTRSRSVQLGVVGPSGMWSVRALAGADPQLLYDYVDHYVADDPRMAFSMRNPGRVAACHQAADTTVLERSALVNDLLDKNEARFAMAVLLPAGGGYAAIVCGMRARRAGQYNEEELRHLSILAPHFQRAVSLHVRLGRFESHLAALDALVDRIDDPVLLVDAAGTLLHANPRGLDALQRGDFLLLRNGRVAARGEKNECQLADALAGLSVGPLHPAVDASLSLLDEKGNPAALVIRSLRGQVNLHGMPQADAALFLLRAADSRPGAAQRLHEIFDLTPAEARLAAGLTAGKGLTEMAHELTLSRETLRSQLSSVFAKTDTRRQGELVARMASVLTVPLV